MPNQYRRALLRRRSTAALLTAFTAALLAGCATTTPAVDTAAPAVGAEQTIEGRIVSVDTAPWAYDGNAVVAVDTGDAGTIRVQLPARWNLCKAQAPDDLQALRPGDRVEVRGTVSAPGELVVCERPEHALRRRD